MTLFMKAELHKQQTWNTSQMLFKGLGRRCFRTLVLRYFPVSVTPFFVEILSKQDRVSESVRFSPKVVDCNRETHEGMGRLPAVHILAVTCGSGIRSFGAKCAIWKWVHSKLFKLMSIWDFESQIEFCLCGGLKDAECGILCCLSSWILVGMLMELVFAGGSEC